MRHKISYWIVFGYVSNIAFCYHYVNEVFCICFFIVGLICFLTTLKLQFSVR
ncbi:hypothetical protein VCHA34P121_20396 [Vibrio chagasii]|nr:hypothetical protein VCHA34P121_20396 [Vibrio chagasii]